MVSAQDVKKLREKTGAGMMECKKALEECGGDFQAAEKHLKEKGLAAVEKRLDKAANEGKIFIKEAGNKAVLVEISTETDFVARNPEFIALGESIAAAALENSIKEPNEELQNLVKDLAAKIRENMSLKRISLVEAAAGECISTYSHGDGIIGVAVVASSDKAGALDGADGKGFVHDLALHVAAFNPLAISRDALEPAFVQEQEDIFKAQMEADENVAAKPANVKDGILKGKVNKYLSSICFLDQPFVKDDKLTVAKALDEIGKKVGAKVAIKKYA
jgi:elongation factor Ts